MTSAIGHADHDHGPHPDDPVKRDEHMAAINLVNPATAIVATGRSSALAGLTPGSDLYVPAGAEFHVDADLNVRRIRFDGMLRMTTDSCVLRIETLIGNTTGKLLVPASPQLRLIGIKARGQRDRIGDPTDISGGIVLHSKDNLIAGDPKTLVAVPTSINMRTLRFAEPVDNWQIGDKLLVPGVKQGMADEIGIISAIEDDNRQVIVSQSLLSSRVLPDGSFPAVGNMTSSLTIYSESEELSQRGHVMVMHEHTGTTFAHVRFHNLGRTTVEATPTKILLGPDGEFIAGDANTIGRYPLHFHGRSGADPNVDPHHVNGCVVEGSPTHGLVNHGSHVSFQTNVVYDCGGSSLFGENGQEIGDFTNNLAVLSRGRQSVANKATERAANNFGWEGFCLWLQGPGMKVIGNHLYRAKTALMATDYTMLPDGGSQFNFPVSYMHAGPQKDKYLAEGKKTVGVFQVPSHFVGNTGAGSPIGLAMGQSMYDTYSLGDGVIHTKGRYLERAKLHGFRFFNVDAGFSGTYVAHLDVRGCHVEGNLKLINWWRPYFGTFDGTKVHDVNYIDCTFKRFQIAVLDRGWSDLDVERCTFEDNLIDIQVITKSSVQNSHVVTIKNNHHLGRPAMLAFYATKNPATIWGKPSDYWFHEQYKPNGKIATNDTNPSLSIKQVFYDSPHTIDGRPLYYPDNADSFVPWDASVATEYAGKTNAELWSEFGKAVNGRRFDASDPKMERLAIDANLPIYAEKLAEPPDPPEPPTVEERLDLIEQRLDALERRTEP